MAVPRAPVLEQKINRGTNLLLHNYYSHFRFNIECQNVELLIDITEFKLFIIVSPLFGYYEQFVVDMCSNYPTGGLVD